ncbi:MAG: hypothetical protein S4CHLAM102_06340 [Chlamydiia bacterium]|nr:hypothetical protein [Chlamydiia bacterium]
MKTLRLIFFSLFVVGVGFFFGSQVVYRGKNGCDSSHDDASVRLSVLFTPSGERSDVIESFDRLMEQAYPNFEVWLGKGKWQAHCEERARLSNRLVVHRGDETNFVFFSQAIEKNPIDQVYLPLSGNERLIDCHVLCEIAMKHAAGECMMTHFPTLDQETMRRLPIKKVKRKTESAYIGLVSFTGAAFKQVPKGEWAQKEEDITHLLYMLKGARKYTHLSSTPKLYAPKRYKVVADYSTKEKKFLEPEKMEIDQGVDVVAFLSGELDQLREQASQMVLNITGFQAMSVICSGLSKEELECLRREYSQITWIGLDIESLDREFKPYVMNQLYNVNVTRAKKALFLSGQGALHAPIDLARMRVMMNAVGSAGGYGTLSGPPQFANQLDQIDQLVIDKKCFESALANHPFSNVDQLGQVLAETTQEKGYWVIQ